MTEAASLNGVSQTTLEAKISALEAKVALLGKNNHEVHEKTFTLTENSIGRGTEIAIAQVYCTTGNTNILAIETGLS